MFDGRRYILEFCDKGKYKYPFYTTPEYLKDKDINHKKFTEFKNSFVDPIIYTEMHNPWQARRINTTKAYFLFRKK